MTTTGSVRREGAVVEPADLINFESLLTPEELALKAQVRALVDDQIRPHIAEWYENAYFPLEIVPDMARLGLLGMHLKGFGCAGRSAVEYGLAAAELEAGDSGLRTFVSVQGSLAMSAIATWGSEEQKQQWLPRMAGGEALGCFGLTEPTAGSDPSSIQTTARRGGGDWVLNGTKRWIGLANVAKVAVIWARTDEGIRGFVVPTDTPGYTATVIEPKLSMRASTQCEIGLTDVRLPADAVLPEARGLRAPFSCLNEARYGIIWGVMGAARDSFEAALAYSKERPAVRQAPGRLPAHPAEAGRHGPGDQQGLPAGPAHRPAQGRCQAATPPDLGREAEQLS